MPATPRSCCSKLLSRGSCCSGSLMLRLQNLLRIDVVGGKQRQRTQLVAEVGDPQAAHREGNHKIGPGHAEVLRKIWLDDPEQIHVAHEQQPRRNPYELGYIALE